MLPLLFITCISAGPLVFILVKRIVDEDHERGWKRREAALRAQGIAPLRPENWPAIHNRERALRVAGWVGLFLFVVWMLVDMAS